MMVLDKADFKKYINTVMSDDETDDLVLRAYDTRRGKVTPVGVLNAAKRFGIRSLVEAPPHTRIIEADWFVFHDVLAHEYPEPHIGFGAGLLVGYHRYIALRDGELKRARLNRETRL